MIKKILAIMATISYLPISAQVGIKTAFPQQALHVSGAGTNANQPVIRIDGLNSQNNPAHEDATSIKRVFTDPNGSLLITSNQTNSINSFTPLPNTAIPGGAEVLVTKSSFTLDYPSIVHVEARVGMLISNQISDPASATSTLLRDGQARLFGSYFKLTSAPTGISTNTPFGQVIISYSTNTGGAQLSGQYYIEPRKDLYLPKGTYTLALYGYSQDNNLNFIVNDTNQKSQQMIINITPVSY